MQANRIKAILKGLMFLLVVISFSTGCAEVKRSRIVRKTKTDSCDLSEMGKNRYFHSNHYKKRISKSTRKIHRHIF